MSLTYNNFSDNENINELDKLWSEITGSDGTPGATGELVENYIKNTRAGAINSIELEGSKYIFTMKDGSTKELNLVQGTTSYTYDFQITNFSLEASEESSNNSAVLVTEKNSITSAKLFYTLSAQSVFTIEGVPQDAKDWKGNVRIQVALCNLSDGSDFNTCRDKKEFIIPTSLSENELDISSLFKNISDTRGNKYIVVVISNDELAKKYMAKKGDVPYLVMVLSYSLDFPDISILKTNTITITNISGARIQYYVRNISSGSTSSVTCESALVTGGTYTLTLPTEGITESSVFAISIRTSSVSGKFNSQWENYNVIYQPTTASTGLVAINNIANEVQDCNNNLLFNVVTTDRLTANVKIYVFKSSNSDDLYYLNTESETTDYFKKHLDLVYKEISLELTNDTESSVYPQSIYVEGITEKQFYLTFIIEDSLGNAYKFVGFNPDNIPQADYTFLVGSYPITVNTVSDYNETQRLYHYSRNKKIDFSQIQTNSLFTEDVLNELDSSDGMKYENTVYFKASPASGAIFKGKGYSLKSANNENLFNSGTNFSIEFMFSTSNISDVNTEIFNIGNLKVYPDHLRLETGKSEDMPEENEKNVNKLYFISQADYQHSALTHVLITYCKDYYPTTYDYEAIYGNYDLTPLDKFDCIKIYINGTINRVIPRNASAFGESFFQINSTKASTNFYIFRLYNETLNYEQVQKNRISSMFSLADKQTYFLSNDIVFGEEDYNKQIYTLTPEEQSLMGTISLAKCLGEMPFPENYGGIPRNWNKKNVLLFVLDDRDNVAELEANKDYAGWRPPKEGKILQDYIQPLKAPLNYNNKSNKYPRASILVKYVNDTASDYDPEYSGLLYAKEYVKNGELVEYHKAQGSSAKKYAGAYNDLFAKFKYLSDEERAKEKSGNYFYAKILKEEIELPTESDYIDGDVTNESLSTISVWNEESQTLLEIQVPNNKYKANKPSSYKIKGEDFQVAKLVGKVNIASSQLAHKLAACDFYNKAYKELIHKDSPETYYRKAVNEKPFMYFYIKLSDIIAQEGKEKVNINNVSWEDIPYNKAKFYGMMTWGSAKGDKPTFGITDDTVYFEGADNKNACANFKVPWAALQMWDPAKVEETFDYDKDYGNYQVPLQYKQNSGKDANGDPDYLTGLYIYDETIKFKFKIDGENDVNFAPDSWDVTGGTKEVSNKTFKITNSEAFKRFAEFYNAVYLYEPASLRLLPSENVDLDTLETNKKYVATRSITASGTYNTKTSSGNSVAGKDVPYSLLIQTGEVIRWDPLFEKWVPGGLYYDTTKNEWESLNVVNLYNAVYNKLNNGIDIKTYGKIIDASLFSKTLNTYDNFRSSILTSRIGDSEVFKTLKRGFAEVFKCIINYYMISKDVSFHLACMKFLLGTDNRAKNTYWMLRTPDSKIELFQDDLDTICKTDNNGQQTKSYNLLEPPFNELTKQRWGDDASGFFSSYDLIFLEDINKILAEILDRYGKTIIQDFLATLRYYPAICYNHTSEIYYEMPLTIYQNGLATNFCKKLQEKESAWEDFSNNLVPNPTSLSHGGCLEAETLFFKDRLLFLGSLVGSNVADDLDNKIAVKDKGGTGQGTGATMELDFKAAYNLYYYPKLLGTPITDKTPELNAFIERYVKPVSDFDTLCINNDVISKLAIAESSSIEGEENLNEYHLLGTMSGSAALTAAGAINNTHLIRSIVMNKGFEFLDDLLFPNAEKIIINSSDPNTCSFGTDNTRILDLSTKIGSIQELELHGTSLIGRNVTMLNCNALQSLKFYNCLVESLTLPKSHKLDTLVLSDSTKTINVGYYPNLTIDNLDIESCNFTNVTIDARNSSQVIEEFINRTNFGSIEFQNIPEAGLNLSVEAITKLLSVLKTENCKFLGTQKINIIGSLPWEVKKQMLNVYGDIAWKNMFTYTTITTSAISSSEEIISIQDSGIPEYGIVCKSSSGIPSNDLFLENFSYSISDVDKAKGVDIDNTGKITFTEGIDGINFDVTITITYSGRSAVITKHFSKGFIPPKQYDFVYSDGTYNTQYLPSKKLIGWIYYIEQEGDKYYTRIITAKPINGRVGLPYRNSRNFQEGTDEYKLYNGIDYIHDNYPEVATIGYYNETTVSYSFGYKSTAAISYNSECLPLALDSFYRNRELFLTQIVQNYKSITNSTDENININAILSQIYDGSTRKYTFVTQAVVADIPVDVDAILALYPISLEAYRYSEDLALEGKLSTAQWYPADIEDIEYIVQEKLKNCNLLRNGNGWASYYYTDSSGKTLYNYLTDSAYDIMYQKLKNAGTLIPLVLGNISQISSINFSNGYLLTYRLYNLSTGYTYRWQIDSTSSNSDLVNKDFYLTCLVCFEK